MEQKSRRTLILCLTTDPPQQHPPPAQAGALSPPCCPPSQQLRARTAAGHQLCSQHWESTRTPCTQSRLELQLHLGLPSDFTKHEMCSTCWMQPWEHSHVSFIQPFCSSPSPHSFLIALQVGSSSVCFHPAFIDLSSGFPHQF